MEFKQMKHIKLYGSTVDNKLVLCGYDTFALKDAIKASGGKWSSETKSWVITDPTDLTPLNDATAALSELRAQEAKDKRAAEKAQRAFNLTPEGQAIIKAQEKAKVLSALAEKAKGNYSYHWICCEECVVIDWARQHTSCKPCGSFDGLSLNTFRVRGRLYTGD
jgi:hypothetical protein